MENIICTILSLGLVQVILKNGDEKYWCAGSHIYVNINGVRKGSENEAVNCEVGKTNVVNNGQKVVWSSTKQNFGTCSNVIFDVSPGNEPKVQVKTEAGPGDAFCPKFVDLKINDMHFCAKTNQGSYNGENGVYNKYDNSKIHDTTRGRC